MAHNLSWFDSAILENLLASAGLTEGNTSDLDNGRVRFPMGGTAAATPSAQAPVAAVTALPPLEVPEGGLETRLDTLVRWLMGSTGAYSAFLAAEDGTLLAGRLSATYQVVVSSTLGQALEKAMRTVHSSLRADLRGSVVVELDANSVLQFVWSPTPLGRIACGLLLADALSIENIRSIRTALRKTLQET